jgi:hypothetical protein
VSASQYAPRLLATELATNPSNCSYVHLVPLSYLEEPRTLCPLHGSMGFGFKRNPRRRGADQAEPMAKYLADGVPTQSACHSPGKHADAVVIVPWSHAPTYVARTRQDVAKALAAGRPAVWCYRSALTNTSTVSPFALACERVRLMPQPGAYNALRIGTWMKPLPLIKWRTGNR